MSATDGVKSGLALFQHYSSYIWMLYILHLYVAHENKTLMPAQALKHRKKMTAVEKLGKRMLEGEHIY